MKHINKMFVVVLMFAASATANAQATTQATATATIVTPISIVKTADMNFGNLAVDAVNGGTLEILPDGTRTPTGGVSLPATIGTVSAAAFTVTGNAGYTYAITLPSNIVLQHSGAFESMMADTFTSTPSLTGTLTLGTQNITVGATLSVAPGQLDGVYTSSDFDVTVNYN